MAKARAIQGLGADDSFSAAATKILDVRARELIQHADRVLDVDDIGGVHDMRVATRRLRAVLEVFGPCFPRAELKAALSEVKALADLLGGRRDRDVAIASLEEIAQSMSGSDRPGVETLIARLRCEQADANEALAGAVHQERLASLWDRLADLLAGVGETAGGRA